ncbi:SHC SH2 domain-binding protein 1-like [Arapaima gigas]
MAEDAVCAAVPPGPGGDDEEMRETPSWQQLEAGMETETDVEIETHSATGTATTETRLDIQQGKPAFSGEDSGGDSGTDHDTGDSPGTALQRAERPGDSTLPDTFQTDCLLFYERFKAYQDYMLGDCKTSEVKAFIADYLEKVVEPCDWRALWSTEVFDVLIKVTDVNYGELKARVGLVVPLRCEARGCELSEEAMRDLLEATQHTVPLHELHVVYDDSGDFDQTALAVEHLRFFYKHIWRKWDEEDEDDDFDYFVRCVEPRLRLHYDVLEDRVPAGLVAEYQSLLDRCAQIFQEFSSLRNDLGTDSDSELDNVSMVEGLRLCEQMEVLKRKLRIIENPLLRHVLGYKVNSGQQSCRAKGPRPMGTRVVHVVSSSMTVAQLSLLMSDKLCPDFSGEEFELQVRPLPLILAWGGAGYKTAHAKSSKYFRPEWIRRFGLTDEVVIEKRGKGDTFVESTAASAKISNIKFIQHDAIEGIFCVRQGKLEMENCVLQCETTGMVVRTTAQLFMNMCDLYGSKGAGIEIYPGSVCSLVGNGIHHCKEGVLIKDFADELDAMPRITMVNNVIHNNEGYGVILVKPTDSPQEREADSASRDDESEEPKHTADGDRENDKLAGDQAEVPLIVVEETPVDIQYVVPSEVTEGNDAIKKELVATSAKKSRRRKAGMKELGLTQADDTLLSQEMFVSIQGNQFKRNGKGSFGTFQY